MSDIRQSDLLKDDLGLGPVPFPSMKQARIVALVLFGSSLALHILFYNLAFNLSPALQYAAYLLNIMFPFFLVAAYFFTQLQKQIIPPLSLTIPRGNNLWMLLLIVPALYVQIAFLNYSVGRRVPFNWSGIGFMMQSRIFYCLVFVILLPALQEFVFRGVILNGLLKRYPANMALGATTMIAAAPYLYPTSIVLYLPVSFFLAWLYYRSRSLIFTYISNAMLSLIPLLLNINEKYNASAFGKFSDLDGSISSFLAAIMVFWVVIIFFNKDILQSNSTIN
jgi:membrane protease YdiL (CAAX protease family)